MPNSTDDTKAKTDVEDDIIRLGTDCMIITLGLVSSIKDI
jgi:hypothetical protein